MNDRPDISVIIAAYDACATLGACLGALEKSTYPKDRFEVIVVDDGSSDGTGELAESYRRRAVIRITCVRRERGVVYGPGIARNAGLDLARGRIVAFTDADCLPDAAWLPDAAAAILQGGAALVAGEIWCDETLLFPWKMAPAGHFGATANLAYDRDAVGDPRFSSAFKGYYGEDNDFVLRLSAAGHPLRVVNGMRVFHPARRMTFRQVIRRSVWRMNDVLMHKLHGRAVDSGFSPIFRPRFFGRFSSATVVFLGVIATLVLMPSLPAEVARAVTAALAILVATFLLFGYRFCIMYVAANARPATLTDRLKTTSYAMAYVPCLIFARIIGSVKFRHLMI